MHCIHIYTGNGKGKTSAAIGLAVRAAGHGQRVLIARFLKDNQSGELTALAQLPQITLMPNETEFGFVFHMTEAEKQEATAYYTRMFADTVAAAKTGSYQVLLLDEILDACSLNLVPSDPVLEFLKNRPASLEVILTGRDPKPEFLALADYISEIQNRRHPYDRGLTAREGIEY